MPQREVHEEYIPNLESLTAKKKVAAYARVSGEREEAFHSLSAQTSYYQRLISENPEWVFAGVYSDRGITGTKDARPGFQAMLAACREKKIDMVLAKSITRFAQNTVILLETVRELKSLGIAVYFEEEHINTLSGEGELMISLLAARAQEESRSASENQKWRIRKCYEKGIPVTGNCLGYRMVDHQFLIDDEEEQIVQRIFSMYLSGMGLTAIAKKLTEENIANKDGLCKWYIETIRRILQNEKYCGDLKLQKKYRSDFIEKRTMVNKGERPIYLVKDAHDPIISREEFSAVQMEKTSRAHKYAKAKNSEKHVFAGMLRCGICGKHYYRVIAAPGTKYEKPMWACSLSNKYGKEKCKASWKIPEDILIQKVCEVMDSNTMDSSIFSEQVQEILVPDRNTLCFIMKDGSEKRAEWNYRSRRESWTPEMKEAARQKAILYYAVKKEGKNA